MLKFPLAVYLFNSKEVHLGILISINDALIFMLRNYKCPWLNLNNTKVLNQYFKKIIICQLLQVFVTVNMTLHTYNKRNSFFTAIENNTVPNETADPILRLEKLMISRFDGLG